MIYLYIFQLQLKESFKVLLENDISIAIPIGTALKSIQFQQILLLPPSVSIASGRNSKFMVSPLLYSCYFSHPADTSAHNENNESNRTAHGRRQRHRQRSGHGHHIHQQLLIVLLLICLLHAAHNKCQTGTWLASGQQCQRQPAQAAATASGIGLPTAAWHTHRRHQRGAGEACLPPGQLSDHTMGFRDGEHIGIPCGLSPVRREGLQTGSSAGGKRT